MTPPDPDEFEVTVFGRGVGESIVVHLGDGRWIIVDSFRDERPNDETKRLPVAQRYLDDLNVERDHVQDILVSHFDADHYRGVHDLVVYYQQARFWIPTVENPTKLIRALNSVGLDDELRGLAAAVKAAEAGGRLRYAHAGSVPVDHTQDVRVRALSPAHGAVSELFKVLKAAIATGEVRNVRTALRKSNFASIALHLTLGDTGAMLCGDLEDHAAFGWTPALAEVPAHSPTTTLVKVGHHGSSNGLTPQLSDHAAEPILLLAPFTGSKPNLPDAAMMDTLCGWGKELWQAAPNKRQGLARRIGMTGASSGSVTARRRRGDANWTVEEHGLGFRACPHPTWSENH